MMNESIIYGLIIGAFSLIDLFQHNSYHVALKNPTHNIPFPMASHFCDPYRIEYKRIVPYVAY